MFCIILHLSNFSEKSIQQILVFINAVISIELDVTLIVCMPNDVKLQQITSYSAIKEFIVDCITSFKDGISPLDAAMSMALMRLRVSKEDKRLLVLNAVPDNDEQYISIMNCIFSAQKLHVAIDSVVLTESVYLQQASFITNGLYLCVKEDKLLQNLLDAIPNEGKQRLKMSKVDFRATCFCHRKMIDIGFVCSVCLSIFCTETKECKTCLTRFVKK